MKRFFIVFGAVALFALSPALTFAGFLPLGSTVSLDKLIAGQTLTAGDKLFSGFSYSSTGDFPAASDVNVTPGYDPSTGNYGIEITGGFLAFSSSASATLGYTVSVTDPNFRISDVHLAGNPDVLLSAGTMSVSESFAQDSTTLNIHDINGSKQLTDSALLNGTYSSLTVTKQIQGLLNPQAFGVPTLSFIDQTFSQVESRVPEPATLVLLISGTLVAWPAYRLRRRKLS